MRNIKRCSTGYEGFTKYETYKNYDEFKSKNEGYYVFVTLYGQKPSICKLVMKIDQKTKYIKEKA